MLSSCLRFLGAKSLAYVLLCLYALILGIATYVESKEGTPFVQKWIYHSPAFIGFQALLALNILLSILRASYLRQGRYGVWLIHVSILVILGGALVTHLTGREGYMHLREGQTASYMVQREESGTKEVDLPFALELKDFVLTRYPGSASPSSYESFLILHEGEKKQDVHIYMNHTLDVQGYRVFQLSYDPDERGSVLLINEDWMGRYISYTGYILLSVAFLLCFWSKKGRVRQLLARLSRNSNMLLILLSVLCLVPTAKALDYSDVEDSIIPAEEAQRFANLPMQDGHGRIVPVETYASQILRKLHGDDSINGWNAEQFLLSFWLRPDEWMRIPFIKAPNPDIAERYGLNKDYISFVDILTPAGDYLFQEALEIIYQKKANERSRYDKDLLKLDEKINLFHQLRQFQLIKLFPKLDDAQQRWFAAGDEDNAEHFEGEEAMFVSKILTVYLEELQSALDKEGSWEAATHILSLLTIYQEKKGVNSGLDEKRIEAELRYNDWQIFPRSQLAYLILGGLMLLLSWLRVLGGQRVYRVLFITLCVLVLAVLVMHSYGMGLRWYIATYAPWSNSYETMVYIAWMSALVGLIAARRSYFVTAISVLFAGVVLFVSSLSWMDPHMSPLVPVLQSLWLMFHVAVIVAAYGFFGIAFLLAVSNLLLICMRGKKAKISVQNLTDIQEILLWIGLSLMVVGSCLGAIWANESWGRYWGWDPKETWALITILCYVLCTHLRMIPKIHSLYSFNVLSMFSFLSVLMTYFGVNYFLSGMHSYNSSQLPANVLLYLAGSVGLLLLLAIAAKLRKM